MSYDMDAAQLQQALNLPAEQRFDYFIEQVLAHGEIWSLADGEEWMVLTAEGEEYLPVWPHPDMAAAWAGSAHQGSVPKAIALDVWLQRWAPGMQDDGILLAICPGEDPDGVVVDADELKAALQGAPGE